jgi:lipopolysaccharide transport protein LptA
MHILIFCTFSLLTLIPSAYAENSSDSSGGLKQAFSSGNSKAPVFIKSDTLTLDSKDRIFTYKGNVKVVRDEMEITTDLMVGRYAENQELETILCQGNVVVTKGEEMQATSNRALYNVKAGKIELTDEPELARDGNVLAADKIVIYVDEDRSEAEGNVRVKVVKSEDSGSGSSKIKSLVSKSPSEEEDKTVDDTDDKPSEE